MLTVRIKCKALQIHLVLYPANSQRLIAELQTLLILQLPFSTSLDLTSLWQISSKFIKFQNMHFVDIIPAVS